MADRPAVTPEASPLPILGLAVVDVDRHLVVYDRRRCDLHDLDEFGAAIWDQLDGQTSLAAIATGLAASTGADPQVVERDVVAFAAVLLERGLITLGPPSVHDA